MRTAEKNLARVTEAIEKYCAEYTDVTPRDFELGASGCVLVNCEFAVDFLHNHDLKLSELMTHIGEGIGVDVCQSTYDNSINLDFWFGLR